VVSSGTGDPVLFVHGSAGALDEFESQVERLSGRFRTIVYSRRFHPPNPPPHTGDRYTIGEHAADLIAILEGVKSPAHVVGASYGAYVALFAALERPALMRSLVLCEPPVLPLLQETSAGEEEYRRFQREALMPARAAFARGEDGEGVGAFLDGILGRRGAFDALTPPVRRRLLRFAAELRLEFSTPPESYMPMPPAARVRALPTPMLLLTGERSPVMFRMIADALARMLPGVQRIAIPDAGHAMHISNPEYFNACIERFFHLH
jgi:pimeloyl-ACP methyl ester carboxylesterase